MRQQRAFNFNTLLFTKNTHLSSKLNWLTQLATLSAGCTKLNIPISVALRLLRIFNNTNLNTFLKNPDQNLYNELITTLKHFLTQLYKTPTTITTKNVELTTKNCFLFNTILHSIYKPNITQSTAITPELHLIRTQRRFNKRRYARVRAVSRPSF